MEAAGLDPTTALIVAGFGFLGVTVAPIALALINRGGKAKVLDLPPDVAIPRAEYDGLLEQMARLDDECDRLTRENVRLRDQVAELRAGRKR